MKRVILLKDYNGIPKGTELYFDKEKNTFGLEEIEENIGDNVHSTFSRSVNFSKPWVMNLMGKLFEDPDAPKVSEHQELIEAYEKQIEMFQDEINRLKEQR
jgi:hypothetical protein